MFLHAGLGLVAVEGPKRNKRNQTWTLSDRLNLMAIFALTPFPLDKTAVAIAESVEGVWDEYGDMEDTASSIPAYLFSGIARSV